MPITDKQIADKLKQYQFNIRGTPAITMYIIGGKYKGKKLATALKGQKHDYRPTKTIVREVVANIMANSLIISRIDQHEDESLSTTEQLTPDLGFSNAINSKHGMLSECSGLQSKQQYLETGSGIRCLDICCGNGACGIEMLSRGAECVTFIDRSSIACQLTKHNIAHLGIADDSFEIIKRDVKEPASRDSWKLDRIKGKNNSPTPQGMDDLVVQQNNITSLYNFVYIDPPYDQAPEILKSCMADLIEITTFDATIIAEVSSHTRLQPVSGYELVSERRYGNTKLAIYRRI